MAKKLMSWKTKGMNKDLSVSAFNPEFAFDNMNLRLSTNEGNTLLSWVNEKGTVSIKSPEYWEKNGEIVFVDPQDVTWTHYTEANISFEGTVIGSAVINHKLVIFITKWSGITHIADYIYVLEYHDNIKTKMMFTLKYQGNLNFSIEHPLETIVSYESETVQKVYWTDGVNQPRVINIEGNYTVPGTNPIQYKPNFIFDFVLELQLNEKITVVKKLGANGIFAPGVIQYAFTYYNKYGQESNVFYTTPLYYISYSDRGASPEDKVGNAFEITVSKLDYNFDYLRIYSIQRTSINGTPICKRIQDIALDAANEGIYTIDVATSNTTPAPLPLPNYENVNKQVGTVISVPCKGFLKSSYPNLAITTVDGEVTWGEESENDWILWVTQDPILYEGETVYCVFQTDEYSVDTTQPMVILTPSPLDKVSYTDTGTSGDIIDPTALFYIGGKSIIAHTIEQKDNTLFLGNIKDNIFKALNYFKADSNITIDKVNAYTRSFYPNKVFDQDYVYYNQLTARLTSDESSPTVPCAGFKYGEVYRCGVQFQHKTGVWSSPIYIDDVKVLGKPQYNNDNSVSIPVLRGNIGSALYTTLHNNGFRKARAVMAIPNIQNRLSLCQGVICPTVYTTSRRSTNKDLYAQSSWFFRPKTSSVSVDIGTNTGNTGAVAPATSDGTASTVLKYTKRNIATGQPEAGYAYNPDDTNNNIRQVEIQGEYDPNDKFLIDLKTVTLHSPELEFDTQLSVTDFFSSKCYKVGVSSFEKTFSDISIQTETPVTSNNGAGFIHKAFKANKTLGIVSGLFYDDYIINDHNGDSDDIGTYDGEYSSCKWMVYLWNKEGSLNNDVNRPTDKGVATSVLKKKVISNLRYTTSTINLMSEITMDKTPGLFSSDDPTIVKLGEHIYMGNIDTVLTPSKSEGMYFAFNGSSLDNYNIDTSFIQTEKWCKTFYDEIKGSGTTAIMGTEGACWKYRSGAWSVLQDGIGDKYQDLAVKKDLVRMKYKSTPHLVFELNDISAWGNNNDELPICEIRKPEPADYASLYGGDSKDALIECVWIPCGEPVDLSSSGTTFEYSYGDTYFQRYDCLKTYPYTPEDKNQVVEIGSFMLETHINIDGRYDRNRGQLSNLNMTPRNFNLINHVYSQLNNFFTYRIMDDSYYENTEFPNQLTWSKTKESGADVDQWTNVTLASILELDGDKGKLNKLIRLNDQILAFQDTGISQILYNENVQISSTDGVPIEIANSGKVQGKRYLSNTIGCSNKWSMTTTPAGIYFMDSHDKSIYLFNGQLQNLSNQGGFASWAKNNIFLTGQQWSPDFSTSDFVTYYDKLNQDVLFINKNVALAWSEKLQAFTSFYSYEHTPFFCNLDDTGIWIKNGESAITLWKHQAGNYCSFFDANNYSNKPYWMTLVGNPEPQMDKIFTNLEFRACVAGEGTTKVENSTTVFDTPFIPFDFLETWDEYQHGIAQIDVRSGHNLFKHHPDNTTGAGATLIRKFRIWRCDIPRDNVIMTSAQPSASTPTTYTKDVELGITRYSRRPMDRMRNPWLYLKLKKNVPQSGTLPRAEIHDVVMTYFE